MRTITVVDIKGKVYSLDLEDVTIGDSYNKYIHWGWALLILLLFWPALIIFLFVKKKVFPVYRRGCKEILVDEGTGLRIMAEIDNFNKR